MEAEECAAHTARVAAAKLEGRLRGAGLFSRSRRQVFELALLHEPEWSSQRLQHLVRFQAHLRGAQAREFARDVVAPRLYVSQAAVRSLTAELRETHEGWSHCISNILLVLLVAALSLTQTSLAGCGGAYEQSLVTMLEELDWGGGLVLADVRDVRGVAQYGSALVKALYRADPYTPPRCVLNGGAEADQCAGPLYNASWWDRCGAATRFSGYVDGFSRTQVGLVVRQTRFEAEPCDRQAASASTSTSTFASASASASGLPGAVAAAGGGGEEDSSKNPSSLALACTGGGSARTFSSVFGALRPDAIRAPPPNIGAGPFHYSVALDGYFIVLDLGGANLDARASLCRWDYLWSVKWLDHATSKVEFTVTLLNNKSGPGRLVTLAVEFEFSTTGQLTSSVRADSVTSKTWASQRVVLFFTALYAALALLGGMWLLGRAASDLGCCARYRFFRTSRNWGHLRWLLELTICAMHFICISLYVTFALTANGSSEIDASPPLVLSDDGVVVLEGLRRWGGALRIGYGTLLFLLCLRTIDSFAFHQDLGILSATCKEALTDILTWAKVWVTVILIYACVGTLWFAYADPLFASFSTSVTSLAYMSLLILADPQRLMTQGFLLQLYVWSFIALNTVLLFNMMLAILWKAFEKVKEERRTTLGLSVSTSFRLFRYAVAYDLEHYYWRHLRGAAAALCSKNAAASAVSPPPQPKLAALRARRGSGSKDGAWLSFQDMLSDVALEARVLSTQRQIQGRPHTHKERLELLRSGTAVDIPSFLMRRELAQLYRDHALVDALVQVLRFRTAAHAPSQVLRRTGDPTVLILSRLARLEMRVERWRAAARTASSSAKRDQTTSTSPAWPSSPTSSTAPDTPPTSTSPAWPSSPTSSPLPDAPQPRAACAATPIHAPEPVSPVTVGERATPARGLPPHLDWQSSATPSQNG